jgi:hypothetical protein
MSPAQGVPVFIVSSLAFALFGILLAGAVVLPLIAAARTDGRSRPAPPM